MTLTASNEIFPHKCYLPLSPVTLPLSNEQHLTNWGRGDILVPAIFPSALSGDFWRKSSHAHGLDIDISVSSFSSLWPSGDRFFFFFFSQNVSHVEENKCSRGFFVNRNVIRPLCISVSRRERHHSWCSVIEGWNYFLITDWCCFSLSFGWIWKQCERNREKWGGSVKTVNMLLSCRTALLCDWGGCSFDTDATWEVDAWQCLLETRHNSSQRNPASHLLPLQYEPSG